MKRIFQIGFNKCGTTSLVHFFQANGIPSVHWDHGRLAIRMLDNLAASRPATDGYEEFRFFSDMEFTGLRPPRMIRVYLDHFRDVAEQDPDAAFILNTRDKAAWLESRRRHDSGNYLRKYSKLWDCDPEETFRRWSAEWDHHLASVREFFASQPDRLLDFNIDHADPADLAVFASRHFQQRFEPKHFRHLHRTG